MNAPHISDIDRAMGCVNQAAPGPEPDASVRFAQKLAGLALSLMREPCDQASSLAMITETAVKAIPGADCAAVVVPDSSGQLSFQAATGDLPLKATELQQEIGHGPCLVALGQGAQVPDRDTASEPRWPAFGERAAAIGGSDIVCTPLAIGQHTNGCLALIAHTPGAFNEQSAGLAAAPAAHADIALTSAEWRRQLRTAVSTRDVIGQAKGILMERHRITADTAFALLARASQDTNIKLRDVASELCRTGSLPPADRPRAMRRAPESADFDPG